MAYILGEVNTLVPGAKLTPADVLYTYSGVRPLPYAPDKKESDVPRTHVLHEHDRGLAGVVTIVGGKLTTYRQLAEDAVDDAFRRLGRKAPRCATTRLPFPGALDDPAPLRADLVAKGIGGPTADRLVGLYGRRAADVVTSVGDDEELLAVFDPATGAIGAELLFAVRHEFARTLADVLARRVLLAFEPGHGLETVARAAELLGDRLGWDEARRAAEIEEYRRWLGHLAVPGRAPVSTPATITTPTAPPAGKRSS
jgi:glycerol-3-phosphate dehydrogenase